jgi:hypothetical protein
MSFSKNSVVRARLFEPPTTRCYMEHNGRYERRNLVWSLDQSHLSSGVQQNSGWTDYDRQRCILLRKELLGTTRYELAKLVIFFSMFI